MPKLKVWTNTQDEDGTVVMMSATFGAFKLILCRYTTIAPAYTWTCTCATAGIVNRRLTKIQLGAVRREAVRLLFKHLRTLLHDAEGTFGVYP